MERINRLWALSLIVIGIVSLILTGSNLLVIELPGIILILLGLVDLISAAVLIYTTIKRIEHNSH